MSSAAETSGRGQSVPYLGDQISPLGSASVEMTKEAQGASVEMTCGGYELQVTIEFQPSP
jgi:hypothetical protein